MRNYEWCNRVNGFLIFGWRFGWAHQTYIETRHLNLRFRLVSNGSAFVERS